MLLRHVARCSTTSARLGRIQSQSPLKLCNNSRVSQLVPTVNIRGSCCRRFATATSLTPEAADYLKLHRLVEGYRNHGHYKANIDPLGSYVDLQMAKNATSLESYGFSDEDLDRTFQLDSHILPFFGGNEAKVVSLREIVKACEETYCGKYSVEYGHVESPEQRQWLQGRLEIPQPYRYSTEEKTHILRGLSYGAGFEKLLATKFPTEKRYGLDGVESLVPAIAAILERSADHGVNHVVAGTCHRGRLALAGTVYGKPLEALFAEFQGRPGWGLLPGSIGDVKTHLGNEGVHITPDGKELEISLVPNPSHLESVDPVAQGICHAAQRRAGPDGRKSVMCLALHGDAAFTGQGVVYETLGMARLPSYDVGGTVRLIVNNQIGFTATPDRSRSTTYSSDLAKFLGAPIFHVNSDSVEDLVFICKLAADWRAKFQTDCVIDLVCYRRFGHNEMDQPSFTQPKMYQKIAKHVQSQEQYVRQLLGEGSLSQPEIDAAKQTVWDDLNEKFELAKTYTPELSKSPKGWKDLPTLKYLDQNNYTSESTAVEPGAVEQIVQSMTSAPEGFNLHNGVKRGLQARKKALEEGMVDWTAAEAIAMGSLSLEGYHVRVLGEDAQRGTFSQRHAVFHDQKSGETWTPLADIGGDQGEFLIDNSPLSEYGALGFEYGVTMADPNALVIWEAQFGDFTNTAQVIIDNYIANAETKWGDRSGLVLNLPHGLDGQGPEHSSARIERFLMLSNEEGRQWPVNIARQHQDCNIQVVYPTTPANYFHVLRRQMVREYRKREPIPYLVDDLKKSY